MSILINGRGRLAMACGAEEDPGDDGADLGVSADTLTVGHHDDRLSVGRDPTGSEMRCRRR